MVPVEHESEKIATFLGLSCRIWNFEVLGHNDSPVMPIMLYNPANIPAFSRECLKHNVAVVAFPATPLLFARARICISASHSREDLVKALEVWLAPLQFSLLGCFGVNILYYWSDIQTAQI